VIPARPGRQGDPRRMAGAICGFAFRL
jgi:hypothetical protein